MEEHHRFDMQIWILKLHSPQATGRIKTYGFIDLYFLFLFSSFIQSTDDGFDYSHQIKALNVIILVLKLAFYCRTFIAFSWLFRVMF